MLSPTSHELELRNSVLKAVAAAVAVNQRIEMPSRSTNGSAVSPYRGSIGDYVYFFEGEDDLLHLSVTRLDDAGLTPEEGQAVAAFAMPGMPPSLIWIRPGEFSQHFYCGHDDLVKHIPE